MKDYGVELIDGPLAGLGARAVVVLGTEGEVLYSQLVGEIADEFDDAGQNLIARAADGSFLVDGAMTIRDLNRAKDWSLPDDEANTVAGLVILEAQMIPAEGQVFSFHGFRFEVVEKQQNRLSKLRIRQL